MSGRNYEAMIWEPAEGIVQGIAGMIQIRDAKRKAREAQRAAEEAALLAERKAEKQRRDWLAKVAREMSKGSAGNATEKEAAAALKGRGGRPNPMDERMF